MEDCIRISSIQYIILNSNVTPPPPPKKIQAGIVISIIVERYSFGWRISVAVEILIGLVLALCALFLHETPRFLVKKKKVAKALKVLIKIRQDHTKAQSELAEIQSTVRNSRSRESWLQTIKYFCSGSILQR
jgi:MFS family permease